MAAKGKKNNTFLLLVLLIVVAAGTGFMFKDQLLELKDDPMVPPAVREAIDRAIALIPGASVDAPVQPIAETPPPEAPAASAPAANPTPGGTPPMSSFDLTTDAEGLSKAVATMTLEKGGVLKWRFYTNDAPNTVKRITQLISEGFYNGIIFHRVVPGFVVQAGDPTGTGTSGSGVKLKQEFNKHKHVKGIVSMARTQDPDSADSQFFIMLGVADSLDGKYTVIGKVTEGYENVEAIRQGDKIKTFVIQ